MTATVVNAENEYGTYEGIKHYTVYHGFKDFMTCTAPGGTKETHARKDVPMLHQDSTLEKDNAHGEYGMLKVTLTHTGLSLTFTYIHLRTSESDVLKANAKKFKVLTKEHVCNRYFEKCTNYTCLLVCIVHQVNKFLQQQQQSKSWLDFLMVASQIWQRGINTAGHSNQG